MAAENYSQRSLNTPKKLPFPIPNSFSKLLAQMTSQKTPHTHLPKPKPPAPLHPHTSKHQQHNNTPQNKPHTPPVTSPHSSP